MTKLACTPICSTKFLQGKRKRIFLDTMQTEENIKEVEYLHHLKIVKEDIILSELNIAEQN